MKEILCSQPYDRHLLKTLDLVHRVESRYMYIRVCVRRALTDTTLAVLNVV